MNTISNHRMRAAAVIVVLGLGLTACGSGGSGSAGGSDTATYDSMTTTQLAAQAAKEGTVNFYTTFSSDSVTDLVKAFNETYPKIKINVLRLSPEDILPKISTEQRAGTFNADLVSGESTQIGQLKTTGALAPYTPKDEIALPVGLTLPKGFTGVAYITTTVIAYNPKVVAKKRLPVPTGYEDLTDPRWKGQFSLDPSATNWYDTLIQTMGHDKAYDLLKRLGANKPRLAESHTLAVSQVQAGEPAATATAYGYRVASEMDKTPGTLALVNTNPLSTALNLVDVVRKAPHPAAARLLEDWLVSKPGQQSIAKATGQISLRPDVANNPNAWNPAKWKSAYATPILPSDQYNTEVNEMRTALNAP